MVRTRVRPRWSTRILVAALVGALTAAGVVAPHQAAAAELELDGDGSTRSPYQISTASDLLAAAEAINSDPGAYASSAYRLTADIDFAGKSFSGINTFSGVFEGAGHVISDVVYGPVQSGGSDAEGLGFFRSITEATVRNLTIDGLQADAGTTSKWVSGLAIRATRSTIEGNSIIDASLTSRNGEKVAGLIAEMDGGVATNNRIKAQVTANKMAGGVSSYSKNGVTITNNLIDASLTVVVDGKGGTRGVDAGFVANYPGNPSSNSVFSGNVAYDGSIAYSGTVDGFAGRIVGYSGYEGWTASKNIANSAITIGGAPVTGPGTKNQHGDDVTAEQLAAKATYEALGWDFTSKWRFDDTLGHPVPVYTHSLLGDGTAEKPFEIATEEDLEFLAAQLNGGNTRYTGEKNYVLSSDLDFEGRAAWPGIDRFEGVLDGAGHRVSNLVYGPGGAGKQLSFIRQLFEATVNNLVLDTVKADQGAGTQFVAGLAAVAVRSTITGNSVIAANLQGPAAEKVSGLVAELDGGVVTGNWVQVTANANRMPAGAVAYSKNGVTIADNLIEADLTVQVSGGNAGQRGTDAAFAISYPGNPSSGSAYSGNVAYDGSITYSGKVDGFAGRIVGYTGYDGWTASNNIANAAITVGGATVAGPGTKNQHGSDRTLEQLSDQASYEAIGWDFAADWRWDATLKHPVPKYVMPGEIPSRATTTFYGDASTGRAFTWYSTISSDTAVAMLSTDREFPAGSSTIEIAATSETSEHNENFYRAVVRDLLPGQTYYYRLGDKAHGVWSTVGTFKTADGEDDFTFIGLTDTQSQNLAEARLSAATMSKAMSAVPEAEFISHSGDLVEAGAREQDWSDLLDSSRSTLMSTTIAPAAGNHDEATNSFIDHFTLESPNGQDTSRGAYYSFDYNDAHFMVLNTNEDGRTNQQGAQAVSDAQVEWLRKDAIAARAAGAKWLILSLHKGLYTTANHLDDYDIVAMRKVLMPIVDEVDIDLVLQGHDHVMSRTKVLAADPAGIEQARAVETTKYTEIINGKRIEYNVDPDGTIFLLPNTAGAKHYSQKTSARGFDLEQYLQLFDRTGGQEGQNFAAIRVTDSKLTVDMYDIRNESSPRIFESFGIDRSLAPAEAAISALPASDALTTGNAEAVRAARALVEELRPAQRQALQGISTLEAAEKRIRELTGALSTDGSVVAWAKADATQRQAITVRNDTRTAFEDVPVQLRIQDTPDSSSGSLAIFAADGAPLPYEVETWAPGGTSTIWAKVPELPAQSAAVIWAYFGGSDTVNDPTRVWEVDYALVEHFGTDRAAGETATDSTGTASGTLVGADLSASVSSRGTGQVRFNGSRLQYPGDIGGDFDRISISGVYSLTSADIAALSGNAPVIAKESATGDGRTTFWQGIRKNDSRVGTRLAGNSYEFNDVDYNDNFALSADGNPHLVTQVYDGMTYSVFIDGREVSSRMVEYRTTFGDHNVRTTIGDYDTTDGALSSPFRGTIDEIQIAGVAFSPEFEAFRYANYFGDAVSFGERTSRSADQLTLIIGTPVPESDTEAGLVEFAGTVSERSTLTARLAGEEVFSEPVDAGAFKVQVPVDPTGTQEVELLATAGSKTSAPVRVKLNVTDTTAPQKPEVSDNSAEAAPGATQVMLSTTPRTDSRESVEAKFFANELLTLDSANTVVREGTTTDRTPAKLTPGSGTVTGKLSSTTIGDDANPYQIYEISLTEEQAAQEDFHLVWKGTGDDRRVSAWVYNSTDANWVLKDSGSDPDGAVVELDVEAKASEGAVSADRKLHLLVWRGLTSEPFGAEHDYNSEPVAADYDWAFDHVPDSQLYTQATPELFADQMSYVVGRADERKTSMVIQAGDLVNREYLSQEYQWKGAELAMSQLDEASLPYMVSWGNHDYSDPRNNRVMLPKYYPMSRFEGSLEGSPWKWGGSNNIDNYFYTAEIDGAKLLLLTVGFFSADNANDAGLAWAKNVIAQHPEYSVIIATHQSVGTGENNWANGNVTSQLIDPFPNVKLVLGGHITGTGVATRTAADGARVYGILTDYQGRVYGGQQYLKSLSVDAENGLLYANTYSPYLDKTTSEGAWHQKINESAIPGFHGSDSENFVLELDLGGKTTRTLATESLTLAAGAPTQIGPAQSIVGANQAEMVLDGARAEVAYEWYSELSDTAGHTTRSAVQSFILTSAQAPSAPLDVTAAAGATSVTVTWSAPDSDGGSAVTAYEVRLSDGQSVLVDGSLRTVSFNGLEPGKYSATVYARNAAGLSVSSAPSNEVEILKVPVKDPEADAVLTVTGRLVPGGEITISGSGFAPGKEYQVELRTDPITKLATVKADKSGSFTLTRIVPENVAAGNYELASVRDGKDIATLELQIKPLPDGGSDNGGTDNGSNNGGTDNGPNNGGTNNGSNNGGTNNGTDDGKLGGYLPSTGAAGSLPVIGGSIGLLMLLAGLAVFYAYRRNTAS